MSVFVEVLPTACATQTNHHSLRKQAATTQVTMLLRRRLRRFQRLGFMMCPLAEKAGSMKSSFDRPPRNTFRRTQVSL